MVACKATMLRNENIVVSPWLISLKLQTFQLITYMPLFVAYKEP